MAGVVGSGNDGVGMTTTEIVPEFEGVTTPAILPNREAEEALLGAVLINADVWADVGALHADAFYIHRHRWIWEAFQNLHEHDNPIDILTVADELQRAGKLDEAGGRAFLTALINQVPTSLNARAYAALVLDKDARRKGLAELNRKAAELLDELKPIASLLDPSAYATWEDVDLGPIEYAWPGWLVKGLLTLLVSYSGDGKSLLALRICGSFISGQHWPDGSAYQGEKGKALWVECEAAQALNLLRANAFKYPLGSIMTPLDNPLDDVCLDDPEHRAIVEARAALPEVKFIVIDSLSGGSRRKENETGIKDITLWAAKLAKNLNKPILLVHHLGKRKEWDTEVITLDRVRGSSAIVQFARVVWSLSCPDATNRETKRLEQIKNNLGRFPEAIGMTATEKGIDFGKAPTAPHVETVGERCGDLLLELLEAGPMKQKDIQAELDGAGISLRTADRAKDRLGIVSVKKGNTWYWSLAARSGEDG